MEEEVADIKCVFDVLQVCEGTRWRRRWQTSSVCLMCYRCARGHDGGGGGRHQVCV